MDLTDGSERNDGRRARLIATLTRPPEAGDADRLPPGVDSVELRADLAGEPEPPAAATLARALPGGLVYTLRSRAEGGDGPDDPARRAQRILRAASAETDGDPLYARIDLEAARDLHPEVLDAVPPGRRILSWHGPPAPVTDFEERIAAMTDVPAGLYKLVIAPGQAGDALPPLLALAAVARPDVVAFASGDAGVWTRLVAPRLGAPVVYGAFPGAGPGAPGQPEVGSLVSDYGLPDLPPAEALFGVVGRPVTHSLSPRLHNRAYRELGVPALYVAFHAEHFGDFWLEVVESGALEELDLPLRGLSVTAPYKEIAQAVAGAPSPRTQAIGVANTLVVRDGVWEAESTDPEGVVLPIRELGVTLDGASVAVLGAGGAGRAAVVGLAEAGARVTLFNRSEERGRAAARDLGVEFLPLDDFRPSEPAVVVHATSLGRAPGDPLPFDPSELRDDAVVVDLVYAPGGTPLLAAVRAAGRRAVDGREVLLYQALEQFRMMTGRELPVPLAREALGLPPEEER